MNYRFPSRLALRAHRTASTRRLQRHQMIEQLEKRLQFSYSGYSLQASFEPASLPAPVGYVADTGEVYGLQPNNLSYGWNVQNNTIHQEAGNSPSQRYSTRALLNSGGTVYNWSVTLPDGEYLVYVLSGDPSISSSSSINFNITSGSTTLENITGTLSSSSPWIGTADIVMVNNGNLVVRDGAPTNSSITDPLNAVRIVQLPGNINDVTKTCPAANDLITEAETNVNNVTADLNAGGSAESNLEIRDVAKAAWTELGTGYLPSTEPFSATALIGKILALPNDGAGTNWPDTSVTDKNQIYFTYFNIASALNQYQGELQSFITSNQSTLYAALETIMTQPDQPAPSYTNIYTMQLTDMQLLGQLLATSTNPTYATAGSNAEQMAQKNLNTLVSDTRAQGIFSEYDCPIYSQVAWNNLASLYRDFNDPVNQPDMQTQASGLLDYLSEDLSANYFGGSEGALAGAHGRDYDFTSANQTSPPNDPIGHFYAIENFQVETKTATSVLADTSPESEGIATFLNLCEGGYHPAASITAAGDNAGTRTIQETWGTTPGQDKYTYITPYYALGSTSYYNTDNDKEVVGSFAPSYGQTSIAKPVPDVTTVYDGTDDPYGSGNDVSGGKPVHLDDASATVQNQNVLLSVADLGPSLGTASQYFESNIVLPDNATYFVATAPNTVNQVSAQNQALSVGDTLGVEVNGTVFAIRIIEADSLPGNLPPTYDGTHSSQIQLRFDGNSGNQNVGCARLVAYNYYSKTTSKSFTGPCIFAYAMAADYVGTGSPDTFLNAVETATVVNESSGNIHGYEFQYPSSSNYLTAELNTGGTSDTIAARQVNGTAYVPASGFMFTDTNANPTQTNEEQQLLDIVSYQGTFDGTIP